MKEHVFLSNNQDGIVEDYWFMHFLNTTNVLTNRVYCSGNTFILTLFWRVLRDLRALLHNEYWVWIAQWNQSYGWRICQRIDQQEIICNSSCTENIQIICINVCIIKIQVPRAHEINNQRVIAKRTSQIMKHGQDVKFQKWADDNIQ